MAGEVIAITLSYEIFDMVDDEYRDVTYTVQATPQGLVKVIQAMDEAADEPEDENDA